MIIDKIQAESIDTSPSIMKARTARTDMDEQVLQKGEGFGDHEDTVF